MTTFLFSGMRQDDLNRDLDWHMNNDEGKGHFHVILDGNEYATTAPIANRIAAPAGVHLVSCQKIDEAPNPMPAKESCLLTSKRGPASPQFAVLGRVEP